MFHFVMLTVWVSVHGFDLESVKFDFASIFLN